MGAFLPVGKTLEIYVYALAAMPRVAFIPLIIAFLGLQRFWRNGLGAGGLK